jgi:hypothetical protein
MTLLNFFLCCKNNSVPILDVALCDLIEVYLRFQRTYCPVVSFLLAFPPISYMYPPSPKSCYMHSPSPPLWRIISECVFVAAGMCLPRNDRYLRRHRLATAQYVTVQTFEDEHSGFLRTVVPIPYTASRLSWSVSGHGWFVCHYTIPR